MNQIPANLFLRSGSPCKDRESTAEDGLDGPGAVIETMDNCTKCGACQTYCPVASVTAQFHGPKYCGPQSQRFRIIENIKESAPSLCSGCGVCTSVCPNGVAITDLITIAKADMVGGDRFLPFTQRLLNRPDLFGKIAAVAPGFANFILHNKPLRRLAHRLFGLHKDAPLPRFHGATFRRWLAQQQQPNGPLVVYFSGCSVEHYDPTVGIAAVGLLNRLGLRVDVPDTACCALPMLSSGEWEAAEKRAKGVTGELAAALPPETAVVSTSTSCSLTLRQKYQRYLSLNDQAARAVADAVQDICEFIRKNHWESLRGKLGPINKRVFYHGPCQLHQHGIGLPALELLRQIPGLEVVVSQSNCCGIAGTYGYDRKKHGISMAIGLSLFEQIASSEPDMVVCDSETCRWHIEQATGVNCQHPVEILAASIEKSTPGPYVNLASQGVPS
ncbi:MAG: anaerobic glycerol-3-phosphate dehydrogenase subunit C [Pseudomonadota bacterium]